MPDAAQILSANGMANAAVIVQGAQLEGMDIAVAATLVAGESWGKHIWGHDGVETGGTYTKGGPVTRQNYEAYRAAMRAGRIGRQGCGITQATSAQYQDTADQLGGCWDMLANCRSGFRGAQALIRRYGLRDGMRRYNGSGPRAEAYADKFMARYDIWKERLDGVAVAAQAGAAAGSKFPTIKRGSTGDAVATIQRFLGVRPVDGKFGGDTDAAVRRYQGMRGLKVDGVVGDGTWRATGL